MTKGGTQAISTVSHVKYTSNWRLSLGNHLNFNVRLTDILSFFLCLKSRKFISVYGKRQKLPFFKRRNNTKYIKSFLFTANTRHDRARALSKGLGTGCKTLPSRLSCLAFRNDRWRAGDPLFFTNSFHININISLFLLTCNRMFVLLNSGLRDIKLSFLSKRAGPAQQVFEWGAGGGGLRRTREPKWKTEGGVGQVACLTLIPLKWWEMHL